MLALLAFPGHAGRGFRTVLSAFPGHAGRRFRSSAWRLRRWHAPAVRRSVFVYGTLMPGRLRWPVIESDVTAVRAAVVQGTLFDTRQGYPGLVLSGDGTVHGWLLELDPASAQAVLSRLDAIEGTDYRRVRVTTTAGEPTETYEWTGDRSGSVVIVSGRWDNPTGELRRRLSAPAPCAQQ